MRSAVMLALAFTAASCAAASSRSSPGARQRQRPSPSVAEPRKPATLELPTSPSSCKTQDDALRAWIAERTAAEPGLTIEVIRGLPDLLVRERLESRHACHDTFSNMSVQAPGCGPGTFKAAVVTRDCCDRNCPADPAGWTLRLQEAVRHANIEAVRRMLAPRTPARIYYAGSDGTGGAWKLTRDDTPLEGLKRVFDAEDGVLQCPPAYLNDESADAVSDASGIRCYWGEMGGTCGTMFTWIGNANQMYLVEAAFNCC